VVTVEAGIRLRDLGAELAKNGLMLPNLGSIDDQSIAGVISTGTHGSTMQRGLFSTAVLGLSILLANGQVVRCSEQVNRDLFRAALLSLGALGIITEITLQTSPAFNIAWQQSLVPLSHVIENWETGLWTSAEFIRVWWMPYLRRAIVWRADKTDLPLRPPPSNFYGGLIGYYVYHNLLFVANYVPRILPWVEWFVFGMEYGFKPGKVVREAVEPGHPGLLMDCLYSQFVNEWAIPLEKGPEAITRLSAWLHGDTDIARIPFSPKGVWVHCPIEVRVSDSTKSKSLRPFLDPSCRTGPTLYLNATLYRPYHRDPPSTARYYEAFEWLMRDLGGRPHWAKNFSSSIDGEVLRSMYGTEMDEWLRVRAESDPDGMFLGEWHRRHLLPPGSDDESTFPLAEREKERRKFGARGAGDGLEWVGERSWLTSIRSRPNADDDKDVDMSAASRCMTSASEESFDHLAHGEASVFLPSQPSP
jgi:D-arabinono-1,4-lactone oxidase